MKLYTSPIGPSPHIARILFALRELTMLSAMRATGTVRAMRTVGPACENQEYGVGRIRNRKGTTRRAHRGPRRPPLFSPFAFKWSAWC